MDREKFLEKLFPLIGGKENTSLCEFQDDALYITLKDAGLADETAVAKLPDVASATLRRGRLTVTFGTPERKEEVPFMANKNTDYSALAKAILANVGGKENVANVAHCSTRLRLTLKNNSLANIDALEKIPGVLKVISGIETQIVIGSEVIYVYEAAKKLCRTADQNSVAVTASEKVTVKSIGKKIVEFLGSH